MRKLYVMSLVVTGLLVAVGAEQPKEKERDARQTAETFLTAALAGKAKEAAALGEPGKAWSREDKIKDDFADWKVKKLAITSMHADDDNALVITEKVAGKKREGPLVIILVKQDKRWLIRDVDHETEDSVKEELKRFQQKYRQARPVFEKKGK